MITTIFNRIFISIMIGIYIMGFLVPVMIIKKKGKDPHGTHEGSSILTRFSSISIGLWFLYLILFIIFGDLISSFLYIPIFNSDIFIIIGMILMSVSFIFELLATLYLGYNFRIELPKEDIELITSGIYRIMRNPIVFGLYLLILGSFFIIPTIINLLLFIINLITFNSKVKDEEKFLLKAFDEEYMHYKIRVGRYFPLLKKSI